MKVKTIERVGEALQYTGENIQELVDTFGIFYVELRSFSILNGKGFPDIRIGKDAWETELLVGDWILNENGELSVIPMYEFEEYFEKI